MIICLTYNSENAKAAESLLDFVFFLHNKKKAPAIVLVGAHDCHEEYRTKIKLAAEVAFLDVDMILADPANVFNAAVERLDSCKDHWIYLDPYCVPLTPRWMGAIEDHYIAQPKKIMGPFLKDDKGTWLDRHSVYPAELFRIQRDDLTPFATKTRIIQVGKYNGRADMRDKSKDDPAYLFCGDKSGELIKTLREEIKLYGKKG